jgi:MFS family permease
MEGAVQAVLRQPGVLPLFLASCVARLPMGALGLLLILHTEERTGSYAAGGLVAGAYVLALGVGSPVLARMVDRRGQALVLRGGAVVCAAGIAVLALLPASTPLGLVLLCAAATGLSQPPIGACMRTLWPQLVPGRDGRHAAYALESVALEVVYIAGPVVIVGGLGALSVLGAMLACAVFVLVGDVAFSLHPLSRAFRVTTAEHHDLAGPLRGAGVRLLIGVFLLCGLTVGAVEVVVAATMDGDERAAGLLLGVWGLGSLLAGIVIARVGAAPDGARRLAVLVAAWGAAHGLVGLAGSPVLLAVVLLIAGATIAPTFVTANGLLDGIAPAGTLTEAFTWTSTGMTAGVAAGGALAGALVDAASPGLAMLALGAVGALGGLLVARGREAALVAPAPAR